MIHKAYGRWLAEFTGTLSPWRMGGFGRWTEMWEKTSFRTKYRVKSGTHRHSKLGEKERVRLRRGTRLRDRKLERQRWNETGWKQKTSIGNTANKSVMKLCLGPLNVGVLKGYNMADMGAKQCKLGWNVGVCRQAVAYIRRGEWGMSWIVTNKHKQGWCFAFYLIWPLCCKTSSTTNICSSSDWWAVVSENANLLVHRIFPTIERTRL